MATLFFSYSHVDENLRDQLEIHLSGLRRQGLIDSWHDRRITAGEEFGAAIDGHIDTSDVILLLISPDFIASDYCYEREMKRALERHDRGEAEVIPVILRPCDWHDLPFGKLLAAPKDGRPITKWPNIDEAFQDVVSAIKGALKPLRKARSHRTQEFRTPGKRLYRSQVDPVTCASKSNSQTWIRIGFAMTGSNTSPSSLRIPWKNSFAEIPDCSRAFRKIDANRFTAAAYRDGEKVCRGSASLGGGTMGSESIEYSMTDEPRHGGMNEAVMVRADDEMIYFEALGMQAYENSKDRLTFQGAAELFWELFIRPLQS